MSPAGFDRSELAGLTARLVAIDSVNPTLVAGAAGEAQIARFVAEWLERAGLDVELDQVAPGRPNVVAVARGRGGGGSLILNAHLDTVDVAGMERALDPYIDGNRLYGRGAYDMKGGLAATMVAAAAAGERRLRGDVVVTAVVDEEAQSIGSEALVRRRHADAAIVAEPTELRVVVAHKGFVWLEVETIGRAAHGSRPDLGVDAIARMGQVLVGLEALEERLRLEDGHPLLGSGSVHASLIEGGQELSTYPERCLLSVERRTLPGESPEAIEEEIRGLLAGTEGLVRTTFVREPFEVSSDERIVEILSAHANDGEPAGVPFWADSSILSRAGMPTVLFGPGGGGAHASSEWVDLDQLERCAEVILETASDFCA